ERARHNFPISQLRPLAPFVDAVIWIKKAAALTHKETGRLEARLADAIVRAADEVLAGSYRDQFVVDPYQAGAGTSHNMNCNEVLANRANELLGGTRGSYAPVHPNDHVNMAQSTNDVIPTAMRLATLATLPSLLDAMNALGGELISKGQEFDGIVKSGRTHLQDATPIRLGQEFLAYAHTVLRHTEKLHQAADWLREMNIGGTAVGTGINAEPDYPGLMVKHLRQVSGLELREGQDRVQLMQSMGDIATLSGAFRAYVLDLNKIANDIRLLASGPRTGLAEILLPAVQPGSSIMPGKVNPVIPEAACMVAAQVMGNDTTIMIGGQSGNFQLNVMLPVIAYNLLQSIELLTNISRLLGESVIEGFTINKKAIQEALERNPILITALNAVIGYEKGAAIAKKAYAEGRPIVEVALADPDVAKKGLKREDLLKLLNP
ncbi:MAG: aspartate ammonia-lyase, partial [Pseudomonadota bacterium]